MPRVLVLSSAVLEIRRALQAVEREGFTTILVAPSDDAIRLLASESPEAVILDLTAAWPTSEPDDLLRHGIPEGCRTLAVIPEAKLPMLRTLPLDDFVLHPPNGEEVLARLTRLLANAIDESAHVIRYSDLLIDTANYTVSLAGHPVELTFKEYELLKFLASNPGRVFTREVLLNRVWGYDYFGGSRTVDVHIRRLRSKIEDRNHTFVDTVRNVGYRFRASSSAVAQQSE